MRNKGRNGNDDKKKLSPEEVEQLKTEIFDAFMNGKLT
jgi:hypothetical protein